MNDLKKENKPQSSAHANTDKPAVSDRKLKANRANAQKSTGPKTQRGKAISRFNALKHGLLAKQAIMADGEVNADLVELMESLREKYGRNDVTVELLLDSLLADYRRNGKAFEIELDYIRRGPYHLRTLLGLERYVTSNRRALLKDLELLEKLQPQTEHVEDDEADLSTADQDPESESVTGNESGSTEQKTPKSEAADDESEMTA
jgi:hypothetical protein